MWPEGHTQRLCCPMELVRPVALSWPCLNTCTGRGPASISRHMNPTMPGVLCCEQQEHRAGAGEHLGAREAAAVIQQAAREHADQGALAAVHVADDGHAHLHAGAALRAPPRQHLR